MDSKFFYFELFHSYTYNNHVLFHSYILYIMSLAGGVVDSSHQPLVLQLMVVCPEDVCKVSKRKKVKMNDSAVIYLKFLY